MRRAASAVAASCLRSRSTCSFAMSVWTGWRSSTDGRRQMLQPRESDGTPVSCAAERAPWSAMWSTGDCLAVLEMAAAEANLTRVHCRSNLANVVDQDWQLPRRAAEYGVFPWKGRATWRKGEGRRREFNGRRFPGPRPRKRRAAPRTRTRKEGRVGGRPRLVTSHRRFF